MIKCCDSVTTSYAYNNMDGQHAIQWTSDISKLLEGWKKQIGTIVASERKNAKKFKKRNYWMVGISTGFAGIGGFATFMTSSECEASIDQEGCESKIWYRVIAGTVTSIGAIISGFNAFLEYGEKATTHKKSADDFDALYRKIDSILLIPISRRGDPVSVIQEIRSEYDNLTRQTDLDTSGYRELPYEVIQPPSPSDFPEVRNETPGGDVLLNMLNDINIDKMKVIDEADAHDTDGDTDVCIKLGTEGIDQTPTSTKSAP